jgi:hypothetical protein
MKAVGFDIDGTWLGFVLATIANNGFGFATIVLDDYQLVDILNIARAVDANEGCNVRVIVVDFY